MKSSIGASIGVWIEQNNRFVQNIESYLKQPLVPCGIANDEPPKTKKPCYRNKNDLCLHENDNASSPIGERLRSHIRCQEARDVS